MLKARTEMMIETMDNLMDKLKSRVTLKDMANMEFEELEMMKETMKLYNMSCEIAMEQARVIEKLERTTDELLKINRTLLSRTKDL